MKNVNSFDVLKTMSERSMQIKLAPVSNIIGADKHGAKCTLTIGIDEDTFNDYMANRRFVGGLILADARQFEEVQRELGNKGQVA